MVYVLQKDFDRWQSKITRNHWNMSTHKRNLAVLLSLMSIFFLFKYQSGDFDCQWRPLYVNSKRNNSKRKRNYWTRRRRSIPALFFLSFEFLSLSLWVSGAVVWNQLENFWSKNRQQRKKRRSIANLDARRPQPPEIKSGQRCFRLERGNHWHQLLRIKWATTEAMSTTRVMAKVKQN